MDTAVIFTQAPYNEFSYTCVDYLYYREGESASSISQIDNLNYIFTIPTANSHGDTFRFYHSIQNRKGMYVLQFEYRSNTDKDEVFSIDICDMFAENGIIATQEWKKHKGCYDISNSPNDPWVVDFIDFNLGAGPSSICIRNIYLQEIEPYNDPNDIIGYKSSPFYFPSSYVTRHYKVFFSGKNLLDPKWIKSGSEWGSNLNWCCHYRYLLPVESNMTFTLTKPNHIKAWVEIFGDDRRTPILDGDPPIEICINGESDEVITFTTHSKGFLLIAFASVDSSSIYSQCCRLYHIQLELNDHATSYENYNGQIFIMSKESKLPYYYESNGILNVLSPHYMNLHYSTTVTGKALMQSFKEAQEIPNENIILNPDFRINQRELPDYSMGEEGYAFDRWSLNASRVFYIDDHIRFEDINHYGPTFKQKIKYGIEKLRGKIFTLTAKVTDASNRFYGVVGIYDDHYEEKVTIEKGGITTFRFEVDQDATFLNVYFCCGSAYCLDINWIKVEEGNISTAFIPPEYTTELEKCRRYFRRYTNVPASLMTAAYSGGIKHYHISENIQDMVNNNISFWRKSAHALRDNLTKAEGYNAINIYKNEGGYLYCGIDHWEIEPDHETINVSFDVDGEYYS